MKKYLCVICLLICFLFTGCSSVSYVYEEDITGVVSDTLIIPISKKGFTELGLSESDYNTVHANAIIEWNTFALEEEQHWQSFVNFQSNIPEDEKAYFLNGVKFENDITSEDRLAFKISFSSPTLRSLFYTWDQPDDGEEDDNVSIRKDNAFTYNVVTTTKTFYASSISDGGVEMNIVDYFYKKTNEWIAGSGIQLQRPTLSFNYSTTDGRLHSDADRISRAGYNYVHSWTLSGTEAQKEVHFYYTEATRWPWYTLAFGVSLLAMGVTFIVASVKNKETKEEK